MNRLVVVEREQTLDVQHGEDGSYNIGRGQVDGTRTLVSAGHLRERIADLLEERERISQRLQAFLEERTKFTRPQPTATFDAKWGQFGITPDFFTRLVYHGV